MSSKGAVSFTVSAKLILYAVPERNHYASFEDECPLVRYQHCCEIRVTPEGAALNGSLAHTRTFRHFCSFDDFSRSIYARGRVSVDARSGRRPAFRKFSDLGAVPPVLCGRHAVLALECLFKLC